jgi:predicted metal-dependent phosphoesterase TrpH
MYADLHLHTHFSDGTYSPEELAGHGRRCELAVMSLTDHDTVEGCARMAAACSRLGIEFIPGTELTCECDDHELHLLGYFIEPEHPRLLEATRRFQEVRHHRVREMVGRLNHLSVKITPEEVFTLANCGSPGRPHIARALVRNGSCASLDDAFERFLKKGRPAWVPKFKMTAVEAIRLVHEVGGLAVLAHPGLYRADEVIPGLADAGLDGIECFHSRHTTHAIEHYLRVASRFRLLPTGGSDCHGMNKGEPLIGSVRLAIDFVNRLRDAAAARRTSAPSPNN